MRELGHRGGKARRRGVAEQLPTPERESLRQHLRDSLDHDLIQAAIERALAGGNESARVAAVKFLADLELCRKDGDEEDRAWAMRQAAAEARQHLANALARRAAVHEERQVRELLEELAAHLQAQAVSEHPTVVVGDVDAERAEAIFASLEKNGLVVRRDKVEAMAEQLAQERLQALRAEHGIPTP